MGTIYWPLMLFSYSRMSRQMMIDSVFKRIYDNAEINTTVSKREMKELIKLCTKDVHFNFNGAAYVLKDGVAMGSP